MKSGQSFVCRNDNKKGSEENLGAFLKMHVLKMLSPSSHPYSASLKAIKKKKKIDVLNLKP